MKDNKFQNVSGNGRSEQRHSVRGCLRVGIVNIKLLAVSVHPELVGPQLVFFPGRKRKDGLPGRCGLLLPVDDHFIDELDLIRVNDVTVSQRFIERILGIGTVTVISNDETTPTLLMQGVDDPVTVKEHIRAAAAKRRKSGLFVERI